MRNSGELCDFDGVKYDETTGIVYANNSSGRISYPKLAKYHHLPISSLMLKQIDIGPITPTKGLRAITGLEQAAAASSPLSDSESKAIEAIVAILQAGCKHRQPQRYFDNNKASLKQLVQKLQYTKKSLLNTVVNAIITVLAVLSVVGITALWLTGKLESNRQQYGSVFSFNLFGPGLKQQAPDVKKATPQVSY
jgi:hypothetical protein